MLINKAVVLIEIFLISVAVAVKTLVITGASSGIGLAAVKQLLAADSQLNIVLACRDESKTVQIIRNLPIICQTRADFQQVDVSDFNSVRRFAGKWKDRPIDYLALNAGAKKPQFSKQGHELTIATNHLGHLLLCQLLMPNLKQAKGRIVFTASGVHNPDEPGGDVGSKATLGNMDGFKQGFVDPICMIDASDGTSYDPDKAYKDSKLCNIMTMRTIAKMLEKEKSPVTVNAFNPGLIPTTALFRTLPKPVQFLFSVLTKSLLRVAVSEEEGGRRLAYMLTSPELAGVTGKYYSGKPGRPEFAAYEVSEEASDDAQCALLYNLSTQLVSR